MFRSRNRSVVVSSRNDRITVQSRLHGLRVMRQYPGARPRPFGQSFPSFWSTQAVDTAFGERLLRACAASTTCAGRQIQLSPRSAQPTLRHADTSLLPTWPSHRPPSRAVSRGLAGTLGCPSQVARRESLRATPDVVEVLPEPRAEPAPPPTGANGEATARQSPHERYRRPAEHGATIPVSFASRSARAYGEPTLRRTTRGNSR